MSKQLGYLPRGNVSKHPPTKSTWVNLLTEKSLSIPGLSILPIPPMEGPELVPPAQYPPGFSAAMAAMANQQLALMTSQGLPFMPHMPALYSSPSGMRPTTLLPYIPSSLLYLTKHDPRRLSLDRNWCIQHNTVSRYTPYFLSGNYRLPINHICERDFFFRRNR